MSWGLIAIGALSAGLLVVGGMLFWSAIQNWIADFIHRMQERLGVATHTAESALVVMDRVMVTGQRMFLLTGKAVFERTNVETETGPEKVQVEEVRKIAAEDLPTDIRARLEKGESLTYELSVSGMQVKRDPTYRLAVRRAE